MKKKIIGTLIIIILILTGNTMADFSLLDHEQVDFADQDLNKSSETVRFEKLGIGISPLLPLTVRGVIGNYAEGTYSSIESHCYSNNSRDSARIEGYRTRNTIASPNSVQENDSLLHIIGYGWNGASKIIAAAISLEVDGPVTSSSMPGRIICKIRDQSNNIVNAFECNSTNVEINNQGLDRNFNIATNANNNTFFIDGANGRIGINNDTPVRKLHIGNNTTSENSIVQIESNATSAIFTLADVDNNSNVQNAFHAFLQDGGRLGAIIGLSGQNGYAPNGTPFANVLQNSLIIAAASPIYTPNLQLGAGSSITVTINGNNRVGINDTTPATELDVNGVVRADDYIEYSPIYTGNALKLLREIKPETNSVKTNGWGKVDHDTLPEEVLVNIKEVFFKNKNGKVMRKEDFIEDFKNNNIKKTEEEIALFSNKIEESYQKVNKNIKGRSISKNIQLLQRAIIQLDEENKELKDKNKILEIRLKRIENKLNI